MVDLESDLTISFRDGVAGIAPAQWDALAGGHPFVSHAFLSALEDSGSVGSTSGWLPIPVVVERHGEMAAAAPAYLKSHSQGEYVFDHGWADAWRRAGGEYYPKIQLAVPVTPVPGPRLLGAHKQHLLAAIETLTAQNGFSSAHMTFADERDAAAAGERGWLIRDGIQYHWFNRGYATFADFLGNLSSRKRKAIRKERQRATQGLTIEALRGPQIGQADWNSMWAFYQDTGARKWGRPYLTRAFFTLISERMGESLLLFIARRNGTPVAGALNVIGPDALYGRYWGALEDVPFLHFELSYYRAIEWAIENKIGRVEAGAQGEHKLARGYEPVITRSAHFIPDPGFRAAIADFTLRESAAIAQDRAWLGGHLPYRSSGSE